VVVIKAVEFSDGACHVKPPRFGDRVEDRRNAIATAQ
jgi:hypothetical protein